jgi:hypothetical protein
VLVTLVHRPRPYQAEEVPEKETPDHLAGRIEQKIRGDQSL